MLCLSLKDSLSHDCYYCIHSLFLLLRTHGICDVLLMIYMVVVFLQYGLDYCDGLRALPHLPTLFTLKGWLESLVSC